MEIKKIEFQQYDNNGNAWPCNTVFSKRRRNSSQIEKKPIEAITFEIVDIRKYSDNNRNEVALLSDLVKSLPDKYVKERMNQVKDSYPVIDDFLVEKLIMEAL
ncbi:MAG TPA: hypothetical protein VHO70_07460 [Chitinispirillaceae bacterium]|nr:hypothetical protein [Chitinispirillaceae bacterium]